MLRTIDFTTDLNHTESIRSTAHIMIRQTNLSERFRVRVTKDGVPYDLSGQTIEACILRADGVTVSEGFAIDIEGIGIIGVTLPAAAYDVPGPAVITITTTNEGGHALPLLCVRATVAIVADTPEENEVRT